MNIIIRLLINALAVFILAYVLNGVVVDGYVGAIIVAAVLSVLNLLVKPILVLLKFNSTLFILCVWIN